MIPLDAFSPDYKTARARFRAMVARRGWTAEAHAIKAPGFAEDELTIDVARVGPTNAERMIILTSGLHGVEAPFGSAVQLAWIDSRPTDWQPPAGCAVLLIHALNPYGFAQSRRANEENVDLNRNFLAADDFNRFKERSLREFAPLDPYLHPAHPPRKPDWTLLLFLQMRIDLGWSILANVLPVGQYAYPKGIFYGGERQAQSTRIMMTQMPRWLGSAKFVIHFDFHSGLGRYGSYRLMLSDQEGSEQEKIARQVFDPRFVEIDRKMEGGYHNFGDMGEWLSRHFTDRLYLYVCAEFGTYNGVHVIGVLRRENQAHFWEERGTPLFQKIKEEFKEAFVPRSPAWRWPAVHNSLKIVQSALNYCVK